MSYGSIIGYGSGESPGVQRNLTPQSTDAAAKQAITPQEPGTEFKPQTHPDVEALVSRLNELETESSNICGKLYGPPNYYATHNKPYTGPPWLERERLQRQIDVIDHEIWSIKAQLREYVDAEGLTTDAGTPFTGEARVIPAPAGG